MRIAEFGMRNKERQVEKKPELEGTLPIFQGVSFGVRLGILGFSIIHKKVGPAPKRSAKGIRNYIRIEAQSSRLCWSCGGQAKIKARQSILTSF